MEKMQCAKCKNPFSQIDDISLCRFCALEHALLKEQECSLSMADWLEIPPLMQLISLYRAVQDSPDLSLVKEIFDNVLEALKARAIKREVENGL